ncbi:MAG: hypothetical protein O3A88_04835 [Proteobacteria bacterium]|nr:hypothetical protein [Pseudomonadota bacterium]
MTTRPRATRSFTAELQRARPAAGKTGAKAKGAGADAASDLGAAARHEQTMAALAPNEQPPA